MGPDWTHERFRIDIKSLDAGGAAKEYLVPIVNSTVLGSFPFRKGFLDHRAVVERIGFWTGCTRSGLLESAVGSIAAGTFSGGGAGGGQGRHREDSEANEEGHFHGNGMIRSRRNSTGQPGICRFGD